MDFDTFKSFFDNLPEEVSLILKSKEEHMTSSNRFNYFEIVSDNYRRETFHSDILATLLNPKTKEIGDICKNLFLRKFLELFNVPFYPEESYAVCTEDRADTEESNGRIDISIVGNGYSIIIENKINFAAEQKNQLARYVESARKKNPDNKIVVVYLTLFPDETQKPAIEAYSKKYQPIVREFNNTIPLHLWAASNTKHAHVWEKHSLIDLLNSCINDISDCNKNDSVFRSALVFMEQYRNLLEMIGGEKMELEEKAKVLDYMAQRKETSKIICEEIWTKKHEIFADYFISRYLAEKNMQLSRIGNDKVFSLKTFSTFTVYLLLGPGIQLGIVFNDRSFGEEKNVEAKAKLNEILNKNPEIETFGGLGESISGGVKWYYFCINFTPKPLENAYQEVKAFIERFPDEFTEEF